MNADELREFAESYYSLLNGPLSGLNLTRISEFEDFYHKQIIDSLLPLEQSEAFLESIGEKNLVVDIGFGGGFPLLPLAKALPGVSFVGFEARKKKVEAVQFICDKLEISNVHLAHLRLEDLLIDCPACFVLKAVGKVEPSLEKFNSQSEFDVYFYKGPKFYELETVETALEDWEIIEENFMELPTNEERLLLGFRPLNVPHGTNQTTAKAKKNKNLVKLSQFT